MIRSRLPQCHRAVNEIIFSNIIETFTDVTETPYLKAVSWKTRKMQPKEDEAIVREGTEHNFRINRYELYKKISVTFCSGNGVAVM